MGDGFRLHIGLCTWGESKSAIKKNHLGLGLRSVNCLMS